MKKSYWVLWAVLFFYTTFVLVAGKMSASYEGCMLIAHDLYLIRGLSSTILLMLAVIILILGSDLFVKIKEKEKCTNQEN